MEKAKGKKNSTKWGKTIWLANPNLGTKRKRSMKEGEASCSEKTAQGTSTRVRIWKKIPTSCGPAWCQQLKLSTEGQKLDVHKRICEYAYPDLKKNIPVTAEDAKILTQRRLMMDKGEMSLESPGTKIPSDGTYPPEWVNTVVTTLAPDAVFASWSRTTARAGKMETVASPQEAHDTEGWVHLQFHAGQAWVPENCSFPPPQLEDNMLCPKCVHRNKVLMKSLQ
ncbi:unnamed protein product [Nyctereutes procyonoides]|uniref:(raccoon dog) hypothetical protein n=1 Tax=Nyctereutes procyonoides TaxID=34880 RepID=A0A811Y5J0_NYCPR|nr:unnamed protein product [Nyctereutes procyonoides]